MKWRLRGEIKSLYKSVLTSVLVACKWLHFSQTEVMQMPLSRLDAYFDCNLKLMEKTK